MKKATFKYLNKFDRAIYGSVTLKDDGKVSISLYDAKFGVSANDRYNAKILANQIVAADFKHDAVTNFTQSNTAGLVAKLKVETSELLKLILEKTERYAKSRFETAKERQQWTEEQWEEQYGTAPVKYPYNGYRIINGKNTMIRITHSLTADGVKERNECKSIFIKGLEKFVQEELKLAQRKYDENIAKLAIRLNSKGIKDDTIMEMATVRQGVHIETTILHEGTSTKAWTIIAEGPIQRPHYRYLVK